MNLLLDNKIRTIRKELKVLRREGNDNVDSIQMVESDLRDVMAKYMDIIGHPFIYLNEEIAKEFCEDFFYEIDSITRKAASIAKFYDKHCTFIDVGFGSIKGRESITMNIMNKFRDITTHHEIIRLTLDKPTTPRGPYLSINCTCRLKLDSDIPRKILHVFDVNRTEGDDNLDHHLVISKEVFVVQDARPLYHHSEVVKVPISTHDNWEPQFKPAVVIPDVVDPATLAVVPDPASVAGGEVSLDGGEEDEDEDDESDVMSQQSSLVKKTSPTHKTNTVTGATITSLVNNTSSLPNATVEGLEGEEQHVEEYAVDDLGGVEDQPSHVVEGDRRQELVSGEGDNDSAVDDHNQNQSELDRMDGEHSLVSQQT